MTKEDAIVAMLTGEKVTHKYFLDNEYIFMQNKEIYDERNMLLHNFWSERTDAYWQYGWQAFREHYSPTPAPANIPPNH